MGEAIHIRGLEAAERQLTVTSRELDSGVARVLLDVGNASVAHMKQRYLSGNPLRVRTGKLRSNWHVRQVERTNESLVIVSTNTAYAAAQNYGVRGAQQVKAHTRRSRAPGGSRAPRSRTARLRSRSEARARSEHRSRLNQQSQGGDKRALNILKRGQRRALGIQGGVTGPRPTAGTGMVSVRAHSRFMKLRGHFYVERTLRDMVPVAKKLLDRYQRGLMDGKART